MTDTAVNSRSNAPPDPESSPTVLCKLFSDQVSEHLCQLRMKELDQKGAFSCEGCPKDAIMRKQLKTAQSNDSCLRDQNA